jgi:uncharacterized membrane protein HdeD (DUF308 family)
MDGDMLVVAWKSLVLRGALAIVFGIFAVAWPISTVVTLAVLWGIWALIDGIGLFVAAADREGPAGGRLLTVLMGVIALLAAFYGIFSPAVTAVTLTWILGIWLMVRGVFGLLAALMSTTPLPRGAVALSGILDIVIGILFAANPGRSAIGLAVLLGILAIAWGVVLVGAGFAVRRGAQQLTA